MAQRTVPAHPYPQPAPARQPDGDHHRHQRRHRAGDQHPDPRAEVLVDAARRVESGHLDLAFVKYGPGDHHGRLVRRDRLVWAGIEGTRVELDRPVPLIVYQAPSLSRSTGVQALEDAGIGHRVTCTVRGVNGVLAAVRAGLGISIFARSLVPEDLTELPVNTGLPELGEIDLVLLTNPRAATGAVEALTTAILASGNPIRNLRR